MVCAATAKSLGASSRSSQKMNLREMKMMVTVAIAKEARSLKWRSAADVLPFSVSPMLLVRY